MKTRLGKRLTALLKAIPEDSTTVWDLCCDHGALGRAVLELHDNCHVVFNDIHPDIMQRLAELLAQFKAQNYTLNVGPAQRIQPCADANQVFVLAGVGDEQCIAILSHLQLLPGAEHYKYIVSPATKTAYVRRFLIENEFRLLAEQVVSENHRSYEILSVTKLSGTGRLLTKEAGDHIGNAWSTSTPQINHLNKLITFYQKQAKNIANDAAEHLARSYQTKLNELIKNQ